ncbi:MAG: sulfotransferase [Hyphomicrobium sp.]|nr:sulfotransferase [Hyphomicrobium sp.]
MDRSVVRKPKVMVVGLSKTGTSTLRTMLEMLGYRVCGPRKKLLPAVRAGDMAGVDELLDVYDAFEDWPWPLVYGHAHQRFGNDIRFVLTTRASPQKWFQSLVNHGRGSSPFRGMWATYGHYRPDGHEAAFKAIYERHNSDVRHYFAAHPGAMAEICLERGDGWNVLCPLVGAAVPAEPVPHSNKAGEKPRLVNRAINSVITPIYARLSG